MIPPVPHDVSALDRLGVTLHDAGGEVNVFSSRAQGIDLVVFERENTDHIVDRVPLVRRDNDVWSGSSAALSSGTTYSLVAWGPDGVQDAFEPEALLLDPYARGITRVGASWRSEVIDATFDWHGVAKPNTPLEQTVIYEAHLRGLTMTHPRIPLELRGTYAGLGHEVMTEYLNDLGVTAVQLLPIHAFTSEERLQQLGLSNYWGYNTLNYFSPHAAYASAAARAGGASGVAREFKSMVASLHRAGIEVILDVVYNHTAEEGLTGPTTSLRGLDNATYYRQTHDGEYVDVTGCGNSLNTARPAVARLILDSLRYWANDMGVDGFRFDLAVTLGRDEAHVFDPAHPLLSAIVSDPALTGVKMIAEPWDTGPDGWQTGNFPPAWSEWNDRFRDRMRGFWLPDIAHARAHGIAPEGVGALATRLAGSSNTFSAERGPLASVNFLTSHDGFTLADLTSYDQKHNIGNAEDNRDGSNDNRSWNHGVEGPSDDPAIVLARRNTMRALLGTLFLSAGVPMMTAGDESGRTQHGNNNAYCHDSPLTWVNWEWQDWQRDLVDTTRHLLALRKELPALHPRVFGRFGESVPQANHMEWFNASGETMDQTQWEDPRNRTLLYLVSTANNECRVLIVIHGVEHPVEVTLPSQPNVELYEPLWVSTHPSPTVTTRAVRPGETVTVEAMSVLVFRVR